MAPSNKKQHLVILSSPAHPTPAIELGKRLVTTQSAKVTVILSCFDKFVASLSKTIAAIPKTDLFNIILLPPADLSGLVDPTHTGLYAVVSGVRVSKPGFLSAISALETPPTALIVHVYAIECLKIADELKVPKYVYICAHAWYLALIIYTPILDEEVGGEFGDKKEPFLLPGCTPVRPEDLPDPMVVQTRKDYLEFLQIGLDFPKADGILVNTWEELQPKTLAALRDDKLLGGIIKARIFPIGPIVTELGAAEVKSELFEWLDKQPSESVLYISFGSMGGLSLEQMGELAWGLELAQQRFIWVVRAPTVKSGTGSAPKFGHNAAGDMSGYLPEGFLDRTKNRGIVVPQWAPQVQILSHPSCGGFLTHCGWNSTLECISNELPMIAWPLYAEQRMNATMLTEEFGIAVRSKTMPSKGVVEREEIATMVRKIFVDEEGKKIRSKVKELKLSSEKAWSHGGSSFSALAEMVAHSQSLQL